MSTQRAHVTTGKASLIGGMVVSVAVMVLWVLATRELGLRGELSLGIGVAVSAAAGIWTRLADL
jgi:hypothetical protein